MRRALCVGIDLYPFGALHGCVSDAERMAALLAKHQDGTPNFECKKLIASSGGALDLVTRVKLRQAIEQLFKDKATVALLHFSGHGTENDLGGYLVTQDAQTECGSHAGHFRLDRLKQAAGVGSEEVLWPRW